MAEAKKPASGAYKGSVIRRFNWALFGLYLASIALSAPAIYWMTKQQVYAQAKNELGLLVGMGKSIRGYVGGTLRPFFMENDIFFAPGFSGVVATADVARHFSGLYPTYHIRTSSDNPLNPANLPKPLEMELLSQFRKNQDLEEIEREGDLDGQRVLVSSAPMVSKAGCMRCHGEPQLVSDQITREFGTDSGYNYELDKVVGISTVAVPLANVNRLALERSGYVVGVLTVIFGLMFIVINVLVRRSLINPVLELRDTVQAVTKGHIEHEVEIKRDDEIGQLAREVELLRRSFATAMKRLKK